MSSYIHFFKLKFLTNLQYRFEAFAGVCAQIAFGFIYISIYVTFYSSGSTNLPMELSKLVSFIWLEQAFFALIYSFYRDKEIIKMIRNGNISYELIRPLDLYFMWFSKIYGDKLSKTVLRLLPIILFAIVLPRPYRLNLSIDIKTLLLFIVSLILASILVTLISLLYHIIMMLTLDPKGVVNIFMSISDLLSGLVIPLPFFPKTFQKISYVLPFRYISDFPFRLYVGEFAFEECIKGIIIQVVWIIAIFIIGKFLMKKILKKAIIQGG